MPSQGVPNNQGMGGGSYSNQYGSPYNNSYNQPVQGLMTPFDIAGLVGFVICVLSTFMPHASINFFGSEMSVKLMDDGRDGIIFLILCIAGGVLLFLKKYKPSFILSNINLDIVLIETVVTKSKLSEASSGYIDLNNIIQFGAGFYLLWVGAIVAFIALLLKLKEVRN